MWNIVRVRDVILKILEHSEGFIRIWFTHYGAAYAATWRNLSYFQMTLGA